MIDSGLDNSAISETASPGRTKVAIKRLLTTLPDGCAPARIAKKVLRISSAPKSEMIANLVASIIGDDRDFEFVNGKWRLAETAFTPISAARFVVVDIETTGGHDPTNRIIELSAFAMERGEIGSSFTSLINPGRNIPAFITNMTGIHNVHVKNSPPAEEVLPSFLHFLSDSVFVAHNARFDYGFIQMELARCGMPTMKNDELCTVKLSRRIFPGETSYGLDGLIRKFSLEINPQDRHRGLGDAWAAAEILKRCFSRLETTDVNSLERLLLFQNHPVDTCRKRIGADQG